MSIISAKPKTTRFYLLATLIVMMVGLGLGVLLQYQAGGGTRVDVPQSKQQQYARQHAYPLNTWQKVKQSHRLLSQKLTQMSVDASVWLKPRPLPEFSLYDYGKQAFTKRQFEGKWSLVFIGFTYCPDICPPTLSILDKVAQNLGEDAPQIVFVSVDPKRDQPENLKAYLQYYKAGVAGVTGDADVLRRVLTEGMLLPYILGKPDENGNYVVDHSGNIMIINPNAEIAGFFRSPLQHADPLAALGKGTKKVSQMTREMQMIQETFTPLKTLQAEQPLLRLGVPDAPSAAGYMHLHNQSAQDVTLVSGSSPAYKLVEFHKMEEKQGMLRMRRIPQISIPAGETFYFKTGAEHIMLIDRQQALADGDQVPVTLNFANGSSQTFELPVKILQQ